jgi:zinc transport system ATP-binding protein
MADETVRMEHVSVGFNDETVLSDVNLSVKFGDFLGIIGPNGGGKTTLLRVILGLIKPDEGMVRVLGKPPGESTSRVGYVAQNVNFDRDFPISVREVVMTARYSRRWGIKSYTEEDLKISTESMETTGVDKFTDRQIGQLSLGQQQRVFIARALATNPKLLILDEPTASIDPEGQQQFYELLERLKNDMSRIMVSHDVTAVSIYVDKIACLNRRLVYHDSKEIGAEELEAMYGCPVHMLAHGEIPHRVLKHHG